MQLGRCLKLSDVSWATMGKARTAQSVTLVLGKGNQENI